MLDDDDAPLSPCLLPAVKVTPKRKESVWSFDPGQSPPEKEYLDVSTHKWILKYNSMLKRAKHCSAGMIGGAQSITSGN